MTFRNSVIAKLVAILFVAPLLFAQSRNIDGARSTVTVYVGKSGIFSAFGHAHEIRGPVTGTLDEQAKAVTIEVEAAKLTVTDPDVSAKDLAEIQRTMLGPEVLDVTRFPLIQFKSESVRMLSSGRWDVRGRLSLHGQVHPASVLVTRPDLHEYRATASLKQSDFGIRPVKVAGGTVRVKDEVKMEFNIKVTEP